jgi:hypothetical protein
MSQFLGWTKEKVEYLQQHGHIRGYTSLKNSDDKKVQEISKSKSKYGNEKVQVNDIEFDSKKEAKRYKELKILLKCGKIGQLARQVEYELNVGGSHSLVYKADFVYIEAGTGETIVEDVKGVRTREYKNKKKLMKQVHNIEIREI